MSSSRLKPSTASARRAPDSPTLTETLLILSASQWKGTASYHTLTIPSISPAPRPVASRIWSYPKPTEPFKDIAGYLSFYASSASNGQTSGGGWKVRVDGEDVIAQPGDFYGGWMTSDISGGKKGVKGGPGTRGW